MLLEKLSIEIMFDLRAYVMKKLHEHAPYKEPTMRSPRWFIKESMIYPRLYGDFLMSTYACIQTQKVLDRQ